MIAFPLRGGEGVDRCQEEDFLQATVKAAHLESTSEQCFQSDSLLDD